MESRELERSVGEGALRALLDWRVWGAARLRNECWQLRDVMLAAGELSE
jgi:hypothetical protein